MLNCFVDPEEVHNFDLSVVGRSIQRHNGIVVDDHEGNEYRRVNLVAACIHQSDKGTYWTGFKSQCSIYPYAIYVDDREVPHMSTMDVGAMFAMTGKVQLHELIDLYNTSCSRALNSSMKHMRFLPDTLIRFH